jgi:hypothetical protein
MLDGWSSSSLLCSLLEFPSIIFGGKEYYVEAFPSHYMSVSSAI